MPLVKPRRRFRESQLNAGNQQAAALQNTRNKARVRRAGVSPGLNAGQQAGGMASPSPMMPPSTPTGQRMRADATQGLGGAKTNYRDSVFRAAMGLGDEGIFAQLRNNPEFAGYQFAADPNSTMATLQRQETQGLRDVDENANNVGNTYFSGLRLNDRTQFSDDIQRQRSGALGGYQDALREYARILAGAESSYGTALTDADQFDIDYQMGLEPEPRAPRKSKPKKKAKKKKG
jgi:hypothetical protein